MLWLPRWLRNNRERRWRKTRCPKCGKRCPRTHERAGFFWPECPCCGVDCLVFADTFDRANSTDIGSDWSEESGDWYISSNQLFPPAIGGGYVLATTALPSGGYKITFELRLPSNSTEWRILFDWSDSSNYHYLKVTTGVSAATLEVVKVTSGTPSSVASTTSTTLSTASNHFISLCVVTADGQFHACVTDRGVAMETTLSLHGGTEWGLQLVTLGAASAACNYATLERVSASCPCQLCDTCPTNSTPIAYEVVISGTGNKGVGCSPTNCGSLDGTYIVPWAVAYLSGGVIVGCDYALDLSVALGGSCGTVESMGVFFGQLPFDSPRIAVTFWTAGPGTIATAGTLVLYFTDTTSGLECPDEETSVTYDSASSSYCSGGTCDITPIYMPT